MQQRPDSRSSAGDTPFAVVVDRFCLSAAGVASIGACATAIRRGLPA